MSIVQRALRRALYLAPLVASQRLIAQAPSEHAVPAPTVVAADGRVISTARVMPGRFIRTLSVLRDGQEQRIGSITETVSLDGSGASATIIRAQEIVMGPRTIIDTAVSNAMTLAPVRHTSKQPTASMLLRFDGRHITGTHTVGDSAPEAVDQMVSVPTFDSNNMELVMGALPLTNGYTARLPFYIYEAHGIAWLDLLVTGDTSIEGVAAWTMDVTFYGAKGTWWFAKDSGRMLKSETTTASGRTMRVTLEK